MMSPEKIDTDTAWHRRLGRRLLPGEVGENRSRGAYFNGRTVWFLAISLLFAILLVGGVVLFRQHGIV